MCISDSSSVRAIRVAHSSCSNLVVNDIARETSVKHHWPLFLSLFSFFVIACTEILMRLCLHHLCLGYFPPTDEEAGCYGCGTVQPLKKKKQNTWRWGGGPSCAGNTISISLRSGPQFAAFLESAVPQRLCLSPTGRDMFCC